MTLPGFHRPVSDRAHSQPVHPCGMGGHGRPAKHKRRLFGGLSGPAPAPGLVPKLGSDSGGVLGRFIPSNGKAAEAARGPPHGAELGRSVLGAPLRGRGLGHGAGFGGGRHRKGGGRGVHQIRPRRRPRRSQSVTEKPGRKEIFRTDDLTNALLLAVAAEVAASPPTAITTTSPSKSSAGLPKP